MKLTELADFVAVARAGSFGRAARETGTPKSTLSKRLQDLETGLGRSLVERGARRLRLTPEGALLLERAERLLGEVRDLERLIGEEDPTPRGLLRVAVPILFGQTFLGQIAATYTRRWPEVRVDARFVDRPVDLIEEGLDCAIQVGRLGELPSGRRPFATSRSMIVGAPGLLDASGAPRRPSDLGRWPVIGFSRAGAAVPWVLEREGASYEATLEVAVQMGNLVAILEAARAGAGLALLPEFLVAPDVRAGRLVQVLEGWRAPPVGLVVIVPAHRPPSARVRAFLEVVEETFPGGALE